MTGGGLPASWLRLFSPCPGSIFGTRKGPDVPAVFAHGDPVCCVIVLFFQIANDLTYLALYKGLRVIYDPGPGPALRLHTPF